MRNTTAFLLLVALTLSATELLLPDDAESSTSGAFSTWIVHSPIRINNDGEMENISTAEGWPGDGSQNDPFILSDFQIFARGAGSGIYIGNVTYSFIIRSCLVHNSSGSWDTYYWQSGIALVNVSRASVEGCQLIDNYNGLFLRNVNGIRVNGTELRSNSWCGLTMEYGDNCTFYDNHILTNPNGIMISEVSRWNNISGNRFTDEQGYAISLKDGPSNNTIFENDIYGFGGSGILIGRCGHNSVLDNTIGNRYTGIEINGGDVFFGSNPYADLSASRNIVSGNKISGGIWGINLDFSSNNTVDGNGITFPDDIGINLGSRSRHETISHNNISYCIGYGISVSGYLNRINDNILMYNRGSTDTYYALNIQGYDSGNSNSWYYNDRGNTWFDWRTPDDNKDGIVDNPYQLDGGSNSDPFPISSFIPVPPGPPLSFSAEEGRYFVSLAWLPPSDVGDPPFAGYRLYRQNGSGPREIYRNLSAFTVRFNDTEVGPGLDYTYWLSAFSWPVEGEAAGPISVSVPPDIFPPTAPRSLTGMSGRYYCNLSWLPPTWDGGSPLTHYRIYRSHLDIEERLAEVPFPQTAYGDSGLLPDNLYTYEVTAVNLAGESSRSNNFQVLTPKPLGQPRVWITYPLEGSRSTVDNITLTWDYALENGTLLGFEIRLGNTSWLNIGNTTTYEMAGLENGLLDIHLRLTTGEGLTALDNITLDIDVLPPVVEITDPSGLFVRNETVEFRWSVHSAGSMIDFIEYNLDLGSWINVGSDLSCFSPLLDEGNHVFMVRAWDVGGRNGTTILHFTVDRTAPSVLDAGPLGREVPPDAVIYVDFGEPVEASGIDLTITPEVKGTLEILNNGTRLEFVPDADLTVGLTYTVTLFASDAAGNFMGPYSWEFTVLPRGNLIRVHGFVIDSKDRKVQNALVSIGNHTDRTDGYGSFEIWVPPGDYTVTILVDGYKPYSKVVSIMATSEYDMGVIVLENLEPGGGSDDGSPGPWLPFIIVVIGGLFTIGYFLLKKQRQSDEFDIEE
ncbi:MAG: right-handed parallel beta-helix repeat-containing protein [Thermoplasmatota archaeon]